MRTAPKPPHRSVGVAVLACLALVGTGASSCRQDEDRPPAGATTATGTPSAGETHATPQPPGHLSGGELRGASRLRLWAGAWLLTPDRGPQAAMPSGVTGWLRRPGGRPQPVDESRSPARFGLVKVSTRREPRLPGTTRVIQLTTPAYASVTLAAHDAGVWVGEYLTRNRCHIRELGLDGGVRRAPRPVTCGTRPVAETPAGLWVSIGPDAITEETVASGPDDTRIALLDPATFEERLAVAWAEPVDERMAVVFPTSRSGPMELRDMSTGGSTPMPLPPFTGLPLPVVGPLSPDGRWLPVAYADPGHVPQVWDLWLLDLSNRAWRHVPSMPVFAALKGTDYAWAGDGRLVIVGAFAVRGQNASRRDLVIWRPGDSQLSRRAYDRHAGPFVVL